MEKAWSKRRNKIIKQRLTDKAVSFSEEELQKIIDDEFFLRTKLKWTSKLLIWLPEEWRL